MMYVYDNYGIRFPKVGGRLTIVLQKFYSMRQAYVVIPTDSLLDGGMIVTDDDEFNGVLPVPIRIGTTV